MGKIIVSENVTLDGAVADPTGEEGTPRGGWFAQVDTGDREAFGSAALEEALAADAFLMGRRTYEFLVSRWPARKGALADRLNNIDKYVVSSTIDEPAWHNTTVLKGDPMPQIVKLKQRITGGIVVPASFELVHTLFEHDLVDELAIMTFPVVLGTGVSPFGEISHTISLQLLASHTLGDHLTHTTYTVVRTA